MVDELNELYHKIRAIPSKHGNHVGWDMACEHLNFAIKGHVGTRVSEAQIENFLEDWALLENVQDRMRLIAHDSSSHEANARRDVASLVALFKREIGTTWAAAIRPNTVPHVSNSPVRQVTPWAEKLGLAQRTGDAAPLNHVRNILRNLSSFFPWTI